MLGRGITLSVLASRNSLVGLGSKELPGKSRMYGIACRSWLQDVAWKVLAGSFCLVGLGWEVFHGRSWLEGIAK